MAQVIIENPILNSPFEEPRRYFCFSDEGRLSFSTELLNQPEDFRRKAIVHELLHMRYPNHGKMFNLLLASYSEKK